jgi:hypothetical protein
MYQAMRTPVLAEPGFKKGTQVAEMLVYGNRGIPKLLITSYRM